MRVVVHLDYNTNKSNVFEHYNGDCFWVLFIDLNQLDLNQPTLALLEHYSYFSVAKAYFSFTQRNSKVVVTDIKQAIIDYILTNSPLRASDDIQRSQ